VQVVLAAECRAAWAKNKFSPFNSKKTWQSQNKALKTKLAEIVARETRKRNCCVYGNLQRSKAKRFDLARSKAEYGLRSHSSRKI
jgi:hypothetical protein